MTNPFKSDFFRKYKAPILYVLSFSVVVLIWAVSAWCIIEFTQPLDKKGQFGDAFGAVNALFSGLAFAGLIVALLLQRDDLKTQRDLLKTQQEELKKSVEAQTNTSNALEEQKEIMLSQNAFATVFRTIDNFNKFRDTNDIPLVMRYFANDCAKEFSTVWWRVSREATNAHDMNSVFARKLYDELTNIIDKHKHYRLLKSYVQFAANVLYTIKVNKKHLGEGRPQAIFLCQLDINESLMLYLSTLHRGDMPPTEGLFWGVSVTRDLISKIKENNAYASNDFSLLNDFELTEAIKPFRIGHSEEA